MSEFFIALRSSSGPGDESLGDIIRVEDDGFGWSQAELPSVVKLPQVPLALGKEYKQRDFELFMKISDLETGNTSGQLIVKRDGFQIGTMTSNNNFKVKTRRRSTNDVGVIEIFNGVGEALDLEGFEVNFNAHRYEMVGTTVSDKTPPE